MGKFIKFLFAATLFYPIMIAHCQSNDTANWTILHITNGTSICKLYNIKLHYSKKLDTTWAIVAKDHHSEFLMPRDTTTLEIPGAEFFIRYYTYDCNCEGKILHKKIDENFVIKKGQSNLIKISDFYIPPEWWQTWWFYLITIFTFACFIFLLLKYYANTRLKSQKKELEQKLIIQKERLRISAEMHDDIGSGLLAVKLQLEPLYRHIKGTELESKFNNINCSIRDIAYKVREVIWSLDAENNTLNNLVSFIHQQAFKMFENSGVELQFESLDTLPELNVTGENRKNIYLTIKEALHNILKHAKASFTKITFSADETFLYALIKDNGTGFSNIISSVESKGLRNMKQRIQELNGEVGFSSSTSGTNIHISIPLADLNK